MPAKKKVFKLTELDIVEVSLVDRPAIRRTFLVTKSEDGVEPLPDHVADVLQQHGIDPATGIDKAQPDPEDVHLAAHPIPKKKKSNKEADMPDLLKLTDATKAEDALEMTKGEFDDLLKDALATQTTEADAAAAEATKAAEETAKAELAKSQAEGKTDLEKAEGRIGLLEADAKVQMFKGHAIEFDWPGSPDEAAATMYSMFKALDEESFKAWSDKEDSRAAEASKSNLFSELGKNSQNAGATFMAQAEQVIEKAGGDYEQMVKAIEANPQVYANAMAEHTANAKFAAR